MVEAPLGLAAFNVRRFGPGKVAEPAVLAALVRIVRRWDMILIQVESYYSYNLPVSEVFSPSGVSRD